MLQSKVLADPETRLRRKFLILLQLQRLRSRLRSSASGTKNYHLSRLQRDHPEIAKKVATGEMSVYAASVAAGLRKAPAKSAKWLKPDAYMELDKASA